MIASFGKLSIKSINTMISGQSRNPFLAVFVAPASCGSELSSSYSSGAGPVPSASGGLFAETNGASTSYSGARHRGHALHDWDARNKHDAWNMCPHTVVAIFFVGSIGSKQTEQFSGCRLGDCKLGDCKLGESIMVDFQNYAKVEVL